jgi:hypothetical protein
MFLSQLNWIAILIGFVIFFAVGAVWFGPKTFYPRWTRLMGLTPEPGKGLGHHGMPFVFALTALGALVQVVALASVIHFVALANGSPVGGLGGLVVGVLVGVGFTAAGSLAHRLFAGHGIRVWLIEVGSDILSLALAGLVIGLFG